MQLPVDLNALINEVISVEEARETSLAVSVYIDETAPSDLAAHVRNAFASSSEHVRMTVTYISEEFIPHPTDDVAIVVAGDTGLAGKQASAIRAVGVPTMVVTTSPTHIGAVSENAGFAIPAEDIMSPWEEGEEEGANITEESAKVLDERMGRWIVAVCRSKRLAFAVAFPFMRRPLAKDSVQLTALENAGVGLIPFLSAADLPIMTLNQSKMALQIAAAYGQSMDKNRVKEIAAVIGGAYLSRSLVRKLVSVVPVLGFVFRTGVAYGTTMAVGYALIEYFEGGEDVTGVANVIERATEASSKVLSTVKEKASEVAPLLTEVTSQS